MHARAYIHTVLGERGESKNRGDLFCLLDSPSSSSARAKAPVARAVSTSPLAFAVAAVAAVAAVGAVAAVAAVATGTLARPLATGPLALAV